MDKNENGYPIRLGCMSANSMNIGCPDGCGIGGVDSGTENMPKNHDCGGNGSCLDRMSLAYVYAPDQIFRMLYSANDALRRGTLFEELYKPMEVYGRE